MAYKQRWLEYFDVLDADKSGFIDIRDNAYFPQSLSLFLGKPLDSPEVKAAADAHTFLLQHLIQDFDLNKDGKVSREELLAGVDKYFVGKTPDTVPDWWKANIKGAFDAFDLNKNGEISEEEVVQFVKHVTPAVTTDQIKAARAWAIKNGGSGKYDFNACSAAVFTWATSPDPTPEASTLFPQLSKH